MATPAGPPSRTVTYGFGAWIGNLAGVTTCSWWPQDPATLTPPFDPSKAITVNLAKNPRAVRVSGMPVADIEVDDDPSNGGGTTIGPTFPGGKLIGGCWLSEDFYNRLPAGKKPARIPPHMNCHAYELTSVTYWSGPFTNRRFWGFYAEITGSHPPLALCSIWAPGKSLDPGQQPLGSWWIDLSTQAHPIAPGLTEIGLNPGDPQKGALFLDAPTRNTVSPYGLKLPPGQGASVLSRTR